MSDMEEQMRALVREIVVYHLNLEPRDDGIIHFAGSVIMPRYYWQRIVALAVELHHQWGELEADT
jgi:hypothetical protein